MKSKLRDFINTTKYKRKLNSLKLKYQTALEDKLKDKEKIEKLQDNLLKSKELIQSLKLEIHMLRMEHPKNGRSKDKR